MAEESHLYSDNGILVTTSRVILEGTTYATAQITSVTMLDAGRPLWPLLISAASLFMAVIAGWLAMVVSVACAMLYFVMKPKYWIVIATAGAETKALGSTDRVMIENVVLAISDAIVQRG